MSFWDNVKKFTQPYSDDEYADEYEEEGVEGFEEEEAAEERPARSGRRTPAFGFASNDNDRAAEPQRTERFGGNIVSMGGKQEVVLFHPANFNDTSKAADDLRSKKAVIVNMENVDKAMARRVVDFLSGCAYAVEGKVNKVAQSTYLFCPYNMEVSGDLENLQADVENYL